MNSKGCLLEHENLEKNLNRKGKNLKNKELESVSSKENYIGIGK